LKWFLQSAFLLWAIVAQESDDGGHSHLVGEYVRVHAFPIHVPSGSPTKIDVGRMNDQYFINVASAGFGAEVTATTPQDMKKLLGGVAYSIMGFIKAFHSL
jgi:hypothetical protein